MSESLAGLNKNTPSYSTDEVFTGKYWTDGSPIYARTIDVETSTYSDSGNRRMFSFNYDYGVKDLTSSGGFWEIKAGSYYVGSQYGFGSVAYIPSSAGGGVVAYGYLIQKDVVAVAIVNTWGTTKVRMVANIEYTKQ